MNGIITLQIGDISNHICTHLWNIENPNSNHEESPCLKELDNSYYFKKRTSDHTNSYYPRTISLSLKGGLGTYSPFIKYPSESHSYSVEKIKEEISWNGDIKEYRLDDQSGMKKSSKSKYSWSEYTSIPYNSNSFLELNEYQQCLPFDTYVMGREAMSKKTENENIYDKIRKEMENCDYVLCYNLYSDIYNGWGGVSSSICEYLNSEDPKIPIISFLNHNKITNKMSKKNLSDRAVSIAMSLKTISEFSKTIFPFDLNLNYNNPNHFYNFDENSLFHKTSVISNSIHSITTPYRCKSNRYDIMTYYNEYINQPNENMKYKEVLIDYPLQPLESLNNASLLNYLMKYKTSNLIDLTTDSVKEDEYEALYSSDVLFNGIKDVKVDEILKELNYECIYSDPHLFDNKCLMSNNYNDFPQYFSSVVKCYSMMVNIRTSSNMCKYFKSVLNNAQQGYTGSKYLYEDVDEKSEILEYFDNMIKLYNDEND